MLVTRILWNIPSIPEILLDRVTLFVPLSIYKIFLLNLKSLAKPVFLILFLLIQLAIGGLIALAWIDITKKFQANQKTEPDREIIQPAFLRPVIASLFCGFILWLMIMLAFFPALGLGFWGARIYPGARLMSLNIAALVFLFAAVLNIMYFFSTIGRGKVPADVIPVSNLRRRLIQRLSLGILALFLSAGAAAIVRKLLEQPGQETTLAVTPQDRPGSESALYTVPPEPTAEITPNDAFYSVSKNFLDPKVDGSTWKLEVVGQVQKTLSYSLEDLKKLPGVEEFRTLECISNEIGGDLIGTAKWKGVPLRYFLEQASPSMYAKKVIFHGADDYADSITLARALSPFNLLVYEMNGEQLPNGHGFPARLLIPGIYGMKNIKWLTKIEVVDYDFQGYWQERGWSDSADIVIMSRIDSPVNNDKYRSNSMNSISGIAFSGDQGISRIEVSQDGGKTWTPAELKEALSPFTWVIWVYEWKPVPGKYNLLVRAADRKGMLQESKEREPYPDGATGYHKITVRIE